MRDEEHGHAADAHRGTEECLERFGSCGGLYLPEPWVYLHVFTNGFEI